MARHLQVEWQEDEATLKQRYLEEKDAQNRTRLQALWLLRCGRTIEGVAIVVGKNPRTVADWLTWYRDGGLAEVLRHRQGGHGGKAPRLTAVQAAALCAAASAGEVRCVQDGRRWVQEHYQVQYTYEGMRHVFGRLGLRKKVPRPRNPKARAEEQTAWKKGA